MKNFKYISQKWRKLTAVLLLLNFFVTPLINAFPQEECSGICDMEIVINECCIDQTETIEMTCCEMMDMNSTNSTTASSECGMELSDMNCALVSKAQVSHVYLIPKTIDNKIEFIQIAIIDFDDENSNIELYVYVQDYSYRNEPPIYLTNASFLI